MMWSWKRKLSDGEFLRLVMRSVSYDGSEINLQPPLSKQQREEAETRASRTLRELIEMVK
jgi:hypothetical protein